MAQSTGIQTLDLLGTESVYQTFGTTSSMGFVDIYTSKYTIDINSITHIHHILLLDVMSSNSANGRTKIQISGDGGTTPFIDITDEIPGGNSTRTGPGLWIDKVNVGIDQLQIRILGKSTDGALATFKMLGVARMDIFFTKIKP